MIKLKGIIKKIEVKPLILTSILLFFGLILLLPFAWMFSASFKPELEIFSFPVNWIPENIMIENYTDILFHATSPFYIYIKNSIIISLGAVLGILFVSSTAGYAFAKLEFWGKNLLFLTFLATLMIPHHVTLIPRFILFRFLGIFDTLWAVIFPNMFNVLGIFLMRQFFMGVPEELSESAKIDGANHYQIFWKIVLPLAKPALISLTILSFVWSWNDYINPLVFLTSRRLYPITLGIQTFLEMDMVRYRYVMAGASIAIIPIIIVFLVAQKYFIKGVVTSGLKG